MQGTIAVDDERRFLRFKFDPRATIGDWLEAQAAFSRLSEETGIRRALVDVRNQQATGPTIELFDFGQNLPSGMVFAVLSEPQRGDHHFVETVALNSGKNVRLFFGPEQEAIDWLMKEAN